MTGALFEGAGMKKTATYPHIVSTPGTCGGRPRIDGHRITVSHVYLCHQEAGLSPEEIASTYRLGLGEVYAALAYSHDHEAEIRREIRRADALAERLRRENPSILKSRRRG